MTWLKNAWFTVTTLVMCVLHRQRRRKAPEACRELCARATTHRVRRISVNCAPAVTAGVLIIMFAGEAGGTVRLVGQLFLDRPHTEPDRDWIIGQLDRSIENALAWGAHTLFVKDHPRGPQYVGSRIEPVDPEWDKYADEAFGRVTRAGLRLGFTVRPEELRLVNGKWEHVAPEMDIAAASQRMAERVRYDFNRWGATFSYVDSSITLDQWHPLPESAFDAALDVDPSIILVPEWPFGWTEGRTLSHPRILPYCEHPQHPWWTEIGVPEIEGRPNNSFVASPNLTPEHYDRLIAGYRRGMTIPVHAWYSDPVGLGLIERIKAVADETQESEVELIADAKGKTGEIKRRAQVYVDAYHALTGKTITPTPNDSVPGNGGGQ